MVLQRCRTMLQPIDLRTQCNYGISWYHKKAVNGMESIIILSIKLLNSQNSYNGPRCMTNVLCSSNNVWLVTCYHHLGCWALDYKFVWYLVLNKYLFKPAKTGFRNRRSPLLTLVGSCNEYKTFSLLVPMGLNHKRCGEPILMHSTNPILQALSNWLFDEYYRSKRDHGPGL